MGINKLFTQLKKNAGRATLNHHLNNNKKEQTFMHIHKHLNYQLSEPNHLALGRKPLPTPIWMQITRSLRWYIFHFSLIHIRKHYFIALFTANLFGCLGCYKYWCKIPKLEECNNTRIFYRYHKSFIFFLWSIKTSVLQVRKCKYHHMK